jgi:hypothetical protein
MKKSGLWHEAMVLGFYVIQSPFFFSVFYSEPINGKEKIIYLIILIINGVAAILSFAIIAALKAVFTNKFVELFYAIIPLICSFYIYNLVSLNFDSNKSMLSTYTISIVVEILMLYMISTYYKSNQNKDIHDEILDR